MAVRVPFSIWACGQSREAVPYSNYPSPTAIMAKNDTDALLGLFTDGDEVDPRDLFELLRPFIRIRNEDGRIIFLDAGHRMPLKSKVLLFLLGKKVLFLLKKIDSEYVTPKQIVDETKLSKGSVLPTLMQLKSTYASAIDGKYFVPNHQIVRLKDKKVFAYEENN